jgi:hypothetical protein
MIFRVRRQFCMFSSETDRYVSDVTQFRPLLREGRAAVRAVSACLKLNG